LSERTRSAPRFCTIAAALVLLTACSHRPHIDIVAPDGKQRAEVNVEIADSEGKRETGLMYRDHLPEDSGMIFVFRSPTRLNFWMKNTEIPLDMIFADANGKVVGIVRNAEPYTENPRGVDANSEYVLEVNGGFAARHHIAPGDRLVFEGFTPHAQN
jgi:uncharacterized membrane protein (UPF0127 family)